MQQYLAQPPQEDAGAYARLVWAVEHDKRDTSIHCLLARDRMSFIETNSFLIPPQFGTGCSFTGSSKTCWAYQAYFGHLKAEFHIHVANEHLVLLTHNPHHVKSSETLFTSQTKRNSHNMPCLDSRCSLEFSEAYALSLWLHYINTHLEQFTLPSDLRDISEATKCNAKPVDSPNNSRSRITYESETIKHFILRVSLRELLQCYSLVEDPKYGNQLESYQIFSSTLPTIISYDPETAEEHSITSLKVNYDHSNHDHLARRLLSHHFAGPAVDSLKIFPSVGQQGREYSKISEYSSSPSSQPFEEISSFKNSFNTDVTSTSMFAKSDDEEADLHNAVAEQAPHSDMVNEFARLTLSWLVAWTASQRDNTGSGWSD